MSAVGFNYAGKSISPLSPEEKDPVDPSSLLQERLITKVQEDKNIWNDTTPEKQRKEILSKVIQKINSYINDQNAWIKNITEQEILDCIHEYIHFIQDPKKEEYKYDLQKTAKLWEYGHIFQAMSFFRVLCTKGLNPSPADLSIAAKRKEPKIVQLLLELGMEPEDDDLTEAIKMEKANVNLVEMRENSAKIIRLLLKHGLTPHGGEYITQAIQEQNIEALDALLEREEEIDTFFPTNDDVSLANRLKLPPDTIKRLEKQFSVAVMDL